MNPPHWSKSGWPRRGLYAITPDEPDTARLRARVEPVLAAGVALLQYRNKTADTALRREQGKALLTVCRRFGVPLIINDDVELARMIGADGVHLGEHDADLREARAALGPEAILGASCYDDLARAQRAAAAGASYLAFGAFFASPTKPFADPSAQTRPSMPGLSNFARRATLDLLRDAARLGLPRVAIGGLTPDNARCVIAAGADLVAAISGVFGAPDPAASARAYCACFEHSAPRPALGHGSGGGSNHPIT